MPCRTPRGRPPHRTAARPSEKRRRFARPHPADKRRKEGEPCHECDDLQKERPARAVPRADLPLFDHVLILSVFDEYLQQPQQDRRPGREQPRPERAGMGELRQDVHRPAHAHRAEEHHDSDDSDRGVSGGHRAGAGADGGQYQGGGEILPHRVFFFHRHQRHSAGPSVQPDLSVRRRHAQPASAEPGPRRGEYRLEGPRPLFRHDDGTCYLAVCGVLFCYSRHRAEQYLYRYL